MDKYAVIGNPVAHSKSPQIQAAFARATGQDMSYERLPAPDDGFLAAVESFARAGGRGLNVTAPFKLEAFALAGAHSSRAKLAGAVNTLKRDEGGWFGDNTDGPGMVRDLTRNLGVALARHDVLVLGAGGAARGIMSSVLAERPRSLTVCNRTFAKAEAIAQMFAPHGPVSAVPLFALAGRSFDVVINATSAGLTDQSPPVWPPESVASGAFAYDLIYADAPTPFRRWAEANGAARTADGIGMLIEQGAESFFLWRGVRPDTAPVFALLRPGRPLIGMGRSITRWIVWLVAAIAAAVVLSQLWFAAHIYWWRDHPVGETSFMAWRMDELHAKNPKAQLKYTWVPYERISGNLKRAMVAAEDAKFVDHEGFDWEGIELAMEKNQKKGRVVAGGSTITQQLAKNLFLSPSRSYWRKAQETVITVMLEAMLPKRRILELYLNVIEWGSGVFGAEAAARHYFGTSAMQLTADQAARLAAMAPNPRFYERNQAAPGLNRKIGIILARMPGADIP